MIYIYIYIYIVFTTLKTMIHKVVKLYLLTNDTPRIAIRGTCVARVPRMRVIYVPARAPWISHADKGVCIPGKFYYTHISVKSMGLRVVECFCE
jgi:hypothetical protein